MARRYLLPAVLVIVLGAASSSIAHAASLTIAWDPPTDGVTVGYIVRGGIEPGVYTESIDVGAVTSFRADGLAEGVTYYIVVQAYSATGQLSGYSEMLSATVPVSGGTTGSTETTTGGNNKGGKRLAKGPKSKATVQDDQYIEVTWETSAADAVTAADSMAAGADVGRLYRVEVGTTPGDTEYSALTRSNRVTFDRTDLPAAEYYFRVREVTSLGVSDFDAELRVETPRPAPPRDAATDRGPCAAPPRPAGSFVATSIGSAVQLSWSPRGGPAPGGFLLEVASVPDFLALMTIEFSGDTRALSGNAGDGTYALRLPTRNACGSSLWAPETSVSVRGAGTIMLPGPARALTQQVVGGTVSLEWAAPASGGPVTRYLIEATTPAGPFLYDTGNTATGFVNAGTPPGIYYVTVRAGNAAGFGPPSGEVRVVVP